MNDLKDSSYSIQDDDYQAITSDYDDFHYVPGSGIQLGDYYKIELARTGLDEGLFLSWSKLSYIVMQAAEVEGPKTMRSNIKNLCKRSRPKPYHLLNEVSGYLKPGMLVLLLGPPGAGKTTLLETLAGRKAVSRTQILSGEIKVNGKPWTPDFNRVCGYVAQDDYHIPQLTVQETLEFSSRLRSHETLSEERKRERVDVVLDVLGIRHVKDTCVGGELLRGVSGGERKRVSIGVELVTMPSVLFMDEPTSGLDSSAAYDVVKALRLVADAGIPVMVSLLQPSQELYNLFDHILVLENRRGAYFGPTATCLEHFEQAGYTCPKNKNVAEFLLEICSGTGNQYANEMHAPGQSLADYYLHSPAYEAVSRTLWFDFEPEQGNQSILPSKRVYNSSVAYQIKVNFGRGTTILWRNRRAVFVRMFRAFVMGLLIGSLFWQLDNNQLGANNRVSLVFFCITFTAMGAVASLPAVVEERRIFYHQRGSHFYRTIAQFLSSLVLDIPLSLLEGFIFGTMTFWMCGLWISEESVGQWFLQYLMFFAILLVTNLVAKQFCRLCAAATPTLGFASSLAPACLSIWLVLAGFLIPRQTIPFYWEPVNIFDPFRYTFESLTLNALSNFSIVCTDNELVPPPNKFNISFCNPWDMYNTTPCYVNQVCGTANGDQILEQFGLNTEPGFIVIDFCILLAFYITFCILTFLALDNIMWFTVKGSSTQNDDNTETAVEVEWDVEKASQLDVDNDLAAGSSLAFYRLNYTVDVASGIIKKIKRVKEWKQLLFDVFGYVPSGRMIALMGATGAGKTTLLDVLARRKTGGVMTGHILVNGNFIDKFYNRLVGYVEQTNVFLPTLTVRETVQYSADMRLPEGTPDYERVQLVDDTLSRLGMDAVQHRMVGDPETGGLSMELRKKLSIAVELASGPEIFFLDEPTTGLDSQAAKRVMETARVVANTGVPVICTIHQPSADLFYLFDWLLLLRPGGHTIYFGPLGEKGKTVISFFERHGLYCDPAKNPADFVLECSGAGIGKREDDPEVGFNIPDDFDNDAVWLNSPEHDTIDQKLSQVVEEAATKKTFDGVSATGHTSEYAVSLGGQIKLSMRRAFMNKYRQPQVVRAYLGSYIFMSIILGTLYWQMPLDQTGARNRVSLMYFCIAFSSLGAISSIPGLVLQRAVYYRERPAFLRPLAYFIAMVTAEVPLVLVSVTIFSVVIYFATGLNLDLFGLHFLIFLVVYALSALTCTFYAMMVASAVATTEVANTIVGVTSSIFSLFAGFMIPKESIPPYWRWLHYLSYFKYPLEALSINEIASQNFTCSDGGEVPIYNHYTDSYNYYCPITDGANFLSGYFTMNTQPYWIAIDTSVLIFYLMVFTVLIYVGIKFINHLKR